MTKAYQVKAVVKAIERLENEKNTAKEKRNEKE
jgi:uncharacterized protein (UPF0335 family)